MLAQEEVVEVVASWPGCWVAQVLCLADRIAMEKGKINHVCTCCPAISDDPALVRQLCCALNC